MDLPLKKRNMSSHFRENFPVFIQFHPTIYHHIHSHNASRMAQHVVFQLVFQLVHDGRSKPPLMGKKPMKHPVLSSQGTKNCRVCRSSFRQSASCSAGGVRDAAGPAGPASWRIWEISVLSLAGEPWEVVTLQGGGPPSDVNVGLDSPHEIYGYLHLVNHRIHQVTNQLSKGTGAPPCGNSWHSEVYTIFNVRWLT